MTKYLVLMCVVKLWLVISYCLNHSTNGYKWKYLRNVGRHVGAVLNLSSFSRYFIHLALALAPSCASQGFSAKSYPNTNLVYFAFHEASLARVTFTIDRVFICRHLIPPFLNCCHNVLGSALCKL